MPTSRTSTGPADGRTRCAWARTPLSIAHHDLEWGVPAHDDRVLFEFLILEGAQAGLSWETILGKRDGYRRAFAGFDPARVARFMPSRLARLLENPGIVRNRLKIASAVGNARTFLKVQEEFGSFDAYVWRFVDGDAPRQPLANAPAGPGAHAAVRRAQQGPPGSRIQVRRLDDLLRVHAGRGDGERPHRRLLLPRPRRADTATPRFRPLAPSRRTRRPSATRESGSRSRRAARRGSTCTKRPNPRRQLG